MSPMGLKTCLDTLLHCATGVLCCCRFWCYTPTAATCWCCCLPYIPVHSNFWDTLYMSVVLVYVYYSHSAHTLRWRWLSSRLSCCVVWQKFTDISEVLAVSIIRAASGHNLEVGHLHMQHCENLETQQYTLFCHSKNACTYISQIPLLPAAKQLKTNERKFLFDSYIASNCHFPREMVHNSESVQHKASRFYRLCVYYISVVKAKQT
jgi:hypothetical protein